jgi:hypothetical protein
VDEDKRGFLRSEMEKVIKEVKDKKATGGA